MSLLGEMVLQSGYVKLKGTVAYHQQQPWIINASMRENILFGLELDVEKLEAGTKPTI